ncbi:MAG: hypothetical protein ACLUFN_03235 [Eubacterium sp.]
MTSLRYSADKHSANFDLQRCFKFSLIPAAFMLVSLTRHFIVNVISEFQIYGLLKSTVAKAIKDNALCMLTSDISFGLIPYLCIFYGLLFSIVNVALSNKGYNNFIFSVPIDRATLFKNRTISALTCMAGVLFVTIFADSIINIYYLSNPVYIIKMALALYAESLVYCFVAYIIFSIGIYACYTVIEGLIFGIFLICLPTGIGSIADSVCRAFLNGYGREEYISNLFNNMFYAGYSNNLLDRSLLVSTTCFNPLCFGRAFGSDRLSDTIFNLCYNNISNFKYGGFDSYYYEDTLTDRPKLEYWLPDMNYIMPVIIWAVIFIGLVFVARYIFIHKKAENTAIHASNKFATLLFTVIFALAVSASVISIISSGENKYIFIITLLLIFLAVFFILNAICTRKAILSKNTYITGAVTGICVLIICGVLSFGGFGYSKYVPDADEIESAAITSTGIADTMHNESKLDEYSTYPLYMLDNSLFAVFSDEDDLVKLTDVAKSLVEKSDDNVDTEVTVVYRLKNGEKVSRNYTIAGKEALFRILSLTDTDAYKSQLKYLMLGDTKDKNDFDEKIETLGLSEENFNYYDKETNFSTSKQVFDNGIVSLQHYGFDDSVKIENTIQLKQALYKDLESSTYEQRFRPDEKEIAQIKFSLYEYYYDEIPESYEQSEELYDIESCVYRIYPSMTNTIEYLKSIGAYRERTNYFVSQPTKAYITTAKKLMSNSSFSYMFESTISDSDIFYTDESVKDVYGDNAVENPEKIKSLISASKPYQYSDDEDIIVLFVSKDKNGKTIYIPMLIKNSEAPQWLSKQYQTK